VRLPPAASGGAPTVIETVNAPGFGPPCHRHEEVEVFRALEGRYHHEVDGRRFHADAGDVASVSGGGEHGFANVTDRPARQFITMLPGPDAAASLTGLGTVMEDGVPDQAALNASGARWKVEFLGPPLRPPDDPA
jgi:hypothetical protein